MKIRSPNLGGWLTVLNCVAWMFLTALASTGEHFPFVALGMLLLGLPLAWLFLMPPVGWRPDEIDVIFGCLMIGLNSVLWGYGLAAIFRRLKPGFGREDQLFPEK